MRDVLSEISVVIKFVVIQQEELLTMPPSKASWSSATIKTMLLSLLRGSAHLTRQVSNVKSSATATRCSPLRLLAHHPGKLVRPSIGASDEPRLTRSHKHRLTLARGPTETQFLFLLRGRGRR